MAGRLVLIFFTLVALAFVLGLGYFAVTDISVPSTQTTETIPNARFFE